MRRLTAALAAIFVLALAAYAWGQSSTINNLALVSSPASSDRFVLQQSGSTRAVAQTRASLLASTVGTSRLVSTSAPLTGGGDMSANRTIGIDSSWPTAQTGWTDAGSTVSTATTTDKVGVGGTPSVGHLYVTGGNAVSTTFTNGDNTGAYAYLQDTGSSTHSGGGILFGSSFGASAQIRMDLESGTGPAGGLIVGTRSTSGNIVGRVQFASTGNVVVGALDGGTAALDVASTSMRLRTAATPASSSAACAAGTIQWDSGFVYVCIATNTWKRAAILTF